MMCIIVRRGRSYTPCRRGEIFRGSARGAPKITKGSIIMKKIASAILTLALATTLPLGLSAAGESAFENVMITADT